MTLARNPRGAASFHLADQYLVRYIAVASSCATIAAILTLLLRMLGLDPFGFEQMPIPRTWCVIGMYFYLAAGVLHLGTLQEPLFLVTVPFLTQFYQVALGREFPDGATSWIRLLPLLVVACQMGYATIRRGYIIAVGELCFCGAVFIVNLVALAQSLPHTPVGPPIVFLVAVLIPVFYFYCGSLIHNNAHGVSRLLAALAIGCLVLLGGFVSTVVLGLNVEIAEHAGSLVGTQNMGDFNTLFPQLLLLYPFASVCARRFHPIALLALATLLVFATLLGFSRTALLVLPIPVTISLLGYLGWSPTKAAVVVAMTVVAAVGVLRLWSRTDDLVMTWLKRFDLDLVATEHVTLADMASAIAPGSDADSIRAGLRREAMEMFEASPLVGHGWGLQLELSPSEVWSSHSMLHDWLAETGVLGAGVVLILLGTAFGRTTRLTLGGKGSYGDPLVGWVSFVLWLVVTQYFGGNLFTASREGFVVNAINGLLVTLYLRPELLAHDA